MIKFKARIAHAVASIIPENEVRYYLKGIYVEPCQEGGIIAVVTDGHRLVAVRDPNGECSEPAILSMTKETVAAAKKNRKSGLIEYAKKSGLRVTDDAGVVKYIQPDNPVCDGKFPEWRRVMPASDTLITGLHGTFNPNYVETAGEIEAALRGGAQPGIRVFSSLKVTNGVNESSMALFRPHSWTETDWLYLVMGLRDEAPDTNQAMPGWIAKK